MLAVEARLGRDLVEYLHDARYQRFLTNKQVADEIGNVPEGTVGYWYTVLGLKEEDMRARAAEEGK